MRAKHRILSKNINNNLKTNYQYIFHYKDSFIKKVNLLTKANNNIRTNQHSKEKNNSISFKSISLVRSNNYSVKNIEKNPLMIETKENIPFRKKSFKNLSEQKYNKISAEKTPINKSPIQRSIKKLSLAEIINGKKKKSSTSKGKSRNKSTKKNKKNLHDKSYLKNKNNCNNIANYSKNIFRINNNLSTSQKSIPKNKNFSAHEKYINSKKNIPKPFIYKREKFRLLKESIKKKNFSPSGNVVQHKRNNFHRFNLFKTEKGFNDNINYESLDKKKNNTKNIIIKISNNIEKIRPIINSKSKISDKNISSYTNSITSSNNKNNNIIINTKYCGNKKKHYIKNNRKVSTSKKIEVIKKPFIKKNSFVNDSHTLDIFLDKKLLDESKSELINNIKINNFDIKKPKEENMKYTLIKSEIDNFDENNSSINKSKIDKIIIGNIEGYKDIIESDRMKNGQNYTDGINNCENIKNNNNNSISLYSKIINKSNASYDEVSELDLNSNKDKNIRILTINLKSDSFDNLSTNENKKNSEHYCTNKILNNNVNFVNDDDKILLDLINNKEHDVRSNIYTPDLHLMSKKISYIKHKKNYYKQNENKKTFSENDNDCFSERVFENNFKTNTIENYKSEKTNLNYIAERREEKCFIF